MRTRNFPLALIGIVLVGGTIVFQENIVNAINKNTETQPTEIQVEETLSNAPTKTEDYVQETNNSDKENNEQMQELIINLNEIQPTDLILPDGFENKQDMHEWAVKSNIIKDTNDMYKTLTVESYEELINYTIENTDKLPLLKTDNPRATVKESYLSCFTEEEIKDNVDVTLNHITRIMSSVLDLYIPYREVTDDEMQLLLEDVDSVSMEDKDCRKKKVVHLIQSNCLPLTYEGKYPMDKVLTKSDYVNVFISLFDSIRVYEPTDETGGCIPCQKEEIRGERSGE